MDSKEVAISRTSSISHVLIFPLPIQSSINTLLKFSEMLCLSGLDVTFLITKHNHERLVRCTNIEARLKQYSGFRFETISDGLSEDNPRSAEQFQEMIVSLQAIAEPHLRERLRSSDITCVIVDNLLYYAADIANEIGIPVMHFPIIGPACLWIYFCVPNIIEAGEFPYEGSDLNKPVTSVQGMEDILRVCDLPYLGPGDYTNNKNGQAALLETQLLPRANGLILNSFDNLDAQILSLLRSHCPNLYCIGPVHQHYKNTIRDATEKVQLQGPRPPGYSNNLWEEDMGSLKWLDQQEPKSVIYVSVGGLSMIKKGDFLELWHGLVGSEVKFLWSIRPGSVDGEMSDHLQFLKNEPKGLSCIVGWVPQEQVLAHSSIGGFLTHSGWASTLESIVEGVPMICWPHYVDQQVTSRLVSEVWKVGLDMKGKCLDREGKCLDREIVKKMVREVMVTGKEEFQKSANRISELAKEAVAKYDDMKRLVSDIKMLSIQANIPAKISCFK